MSLKHPIPFLALLLLAFLLLPAPVGATSEDAAADVVAPPATIQAVTGYTFSQDSGTYTPLTGDTTFAINGGGGNLDDGISATQTIPFPFNFNGSHFTSYRVNSNGWLGFGAPTNRQGFSALMGDENNVIAFANRNLNNIGAVYSHVTEGSAPNRIHKIQAANFHHLHDSSRTGNVQIWLYEGTHIIEIHYGVFTTNWPTHNNVQVGLRGNSISDALGLSGSGPNTWSNPFVSHANVRMSLVDTIIPTPGQIYRWTPPTGQPECPLFPFPHNNATNVNNHRGLAWQTGGGGMPTSYDVYLGTTPTPPLVANVNSTAYTPDPALLYDTTYYWRVVPKNSDGEPLNCATWSFTLMPSYTVPYSQDFNGAIPGWVVEDTNGDGISWYLSSEHTNRYRGNSGAGMVLTRGATSSNDWLFTPPLEMSGGTTYAVRFFYRAGSEHSSHTERLRVSWGTANHSSAMTHEIFNNSFHRLFVRTAIATFTPTEDGTYYVGFHGHSAADRMRVMVDDVTVYEAADNVWDWTGAVDNNWYNGANWKGNIVPGEADTVYIPASAPRQPALNGASGDNSVGRVNHLTIANGAELSLSGNHSLQVQGSLINNGVIQETRNIGAGAAVDFGRINNSGGNGRYYGMRIVNTNGAAGMGSTVVRVSGHQDCTNNPVSQHVQRCFEIFPTTSQPATIRFYYLVSEANGNPENAVRVYHWNEGSERWDLETGTHSHSSSSSNNRWVQVSGVADYSLFVLDDVRPTAVSLSQFSTTSPPALPLATVALLLLLLTGTVSRLAVQTGKK